MESLCKLSRYRLFKNDDGKRVAIVWEDVDLGKMQETLTGPEGSAAKSLDTVVEPIDIFVEIEGGK